MKIRKIIAKSNEEIANLQLKNQQMENNLIDTIMRIEDIDEKTFMKDEEE